MERERGSDDCDPPGGTGAILLGTAIERSNKATALVTMCVGGGQGVATIIERV